MTKFNPSKPFKFLYLVYMISCVGDRLWTFAIVFVMQHLGGMRLVGINQLFESLSLMFSASYVGNWLDRHSRKHGTLTVIGVNNVSISISASLLIICLTIGKSTVFYPFCLTISIFFCAMSSCAAEGQRLAFTKDWIVVMAKVEGGNTLSNRNAMMTTIEQLSSVIAPFVTGLILQNCSYHVACGIFIIWNLISWIIERWLVCIVYQQVPELAVRHRDKDEDNEIKAEINSLTVSETSCWTTLFISIKAYLRQKVFPAAFALALLYMTVLGADGLSISYGQQQGLSEDILGTFRSISSSLGIIGAFLYTFTEQRIGVRKTGLMGLILQLSFLWMCILSIFLPGSPFDPVGYAQEWTFENWLSKFKSSIYLTENSEMLTNSSIPVSTTSELNWSSLHLASDKASILVFFFGQTMSRLGLWMADLSITQIMQESILEEERNTIFGVQNAFSQFFSVMKDVLVILLPDQRTFGLLIIMSVSFVSTGLLQYTWYLMKGDRLWTFAIVFVMQYLGGMRLVGITQLFESLSRMSSASYVGNWLDRHSRKNGTLIIISINNISICISASLLIICLTIGKSTVFYPFCLTASIFFCAISSCATEGQRLAFTKDWIVVMAKVEGENILSNRNAMMTTIDQLSTVIAPFVTGLILQYCTYPIACGMFIIWNLISWILERWLVGHVYQQVPELAVRRKDKNEDNEIKEEINSLTVSKTSCSTTLFISIKAYLRQNIFPAAFALALLYMTVLGFDGLAISHGQEQGLSEDILGTFRSISSALGIIGAFLYTFTEQRLGVRKTGLMGLILQLSFLWMCILSVFLPGSPFDPVGYAQEWTIEDWLLKFKSSIYLTENSETLTNSSISVSTTNELNWSSLHLASEKVSILIFFFGLTMSRLGLWVADLSITQIMQESILEEERNTIFGVQNAFCQFFSVMKDVLVILLPDQRTFGLLIIMSVCFVFIGLLQYTWYLMKTKTNSNRKNSSLEAENNQELENLKKSEDP